MHFLYVNLPASAVGEVGNKENREWYSSLLLLKVRASFRNTQGNTWHSRHSTVNSETSPCDRLTHEEMAQVHTIVGTQFLSVLFIAKRSGLQG